MSIVTEPAATARDVTPYELTAKVAAVLNAVTVWHAGALDVIVNSILPGIYIGDGDDGYAKDLIGDIDNSLEWADLFRHNPLQALRNQGDTVHGGDLTRASEIEAEKWEETALSFSTQLVDMWRRAA